MLELRSLDNLRTIGFVTQSLLDTPFFADLIARKTDFSAGNFYMILPQFIEEEIIYQFNLGGYVRPFIEKGGSIVKSENIADPIISEVAYQFIQVNTANAVGIEDFAWGPSSNIAKQKKRDFVILNEQLFYLLHQGLTKDEVSEFIKVSKSWLSLGMFLDVNPAIINGVRQNNFGELLTNEAEKLFAGLAGFYLEVHDGETLLIWINNHNVALLDLFKQSINKQNNFK